ncbi:hypothetical protein niasHT_016960 [Heterodera trifolii]|uniref:histone acetyltransferase n=1 Tax=Heterodera trifolii TaxID=157864 RepID=A0ABD2LAZ7_9BILA
MEKGKKDGTTNGNHANGNANGTTANTTAPALLTVDARNYVTNFVADDQRMRELAEYGREYAHSIGLCGRTAEHRFQSDIAAAPPLALMPSPFPRSLFTKAFEMQETFRISCDHEFLIEAYKDVIKGDPFIKRCVEIAQQIHDEGVHQPLALSFQRADYLSHWDEQKQCIELKQVGVNIGQVGGPGFATQTNKYHRKMLDKLAIFRAGTGGMEMLAHTEMPVNKPRHKMGQTLYEACCLLEESDFSLCVDGKRVAPHEYREQQPQMLNFVDAAASAPSASSGAVPPLKPIKMKKSQQQSTCTSMPSNSGGGSSAELVSIKHEICVGGTTSTTAGSKATTTSSSSASGGLFPPNASTTGETRRSTTPKDMKPSTSAAPTVQEPIVRDPKVFEANELRQHLVPVWNQLMQFEPACIPFRCPVDPEQLNIPDYFDIIKNPMDLQTIKANLDQDKYKNPWQFCEHMWLMFENAWLYNRKNTKIHKWCTQLSELFVEEINPVMRRMGYCCGQKLSFTPLVQFCFGITKNNAACVIARDQPYFMYESTGFGVMVAERYIYCVKCFEALPDEGINLNVNTPDPPNWIPKPMFQKMKNNQIDMEPFEQCQICDRKWHRICALHSNKIHPGGFVCEQCRVEKNRTRQENKFTAKKLPHYNLSRHIEDRVNNFLRRQLTDSDPEVEVIIRVLCSADKEVKVKPAMLKKYASEGYTDRFPYRSKAVFAFEVVKDPDTGASHEVCFFGLYVQEYGTNCQPPNQRRVYIAYLDSVHFFQPRSLRTSVYYEILLGYLDYAKTLGYTMAHIWACPPSEGADYIFHCHPPEQKIPKSKRLQDWYKTMLNNGQMEGTVYSYKDIYNQARDDGLDTPMKLPYFEGDYWPRFIDECIIGAEKEEEQEKQVKKHEQFQSAECGGVGGVGSTATASLSFQTDDGFPVVKQKQQQQKASSNKKNNNMKKSAQNSKKTGLSTGNPVVDKLFQQLEKHRDVFFTIRLFSAREEQRVLAEKPRIEDPDPLVGCKLMDTRYNFLAKSREEHWEFSQLRRAKWSSLNFCYTLHTQDYDLCDQCHAKTDHPHEMEKQLVLGDDQKSADSAASAASRNDSLKKCII